MGYSFDPDTIRSQGFQITPAELMSLAWLMTYLSHHA
jgi:hypothetical protein